MEFTCLSKGKGYYFPPCHMLEVCGFRILINCPMDLSALSIFAPVTDLKTRVNEDSDNLERSVDGSRKRQKVEMAVKAGDLIQSEPWFKTVSSLSLWNVSTIDFVLISSPMAMLGLPFLTRMDGFCAKVYVTEAAIKLGELLMKDLVEMSKEFRQLCGPVVEFPQWLRWENLDRLPLSLQKLAAGEYGVDVNAWRSIYSTADVKGCLKMIHPLKYAEEICYNGTLIITAFSSGLEVGACNWRLRGPETNFVCLSASIFASTHAADFDFQALQGSDLILCSNMSSLYSDEDDNNDSRTIKIENQETPAESLLANDENLNEMEKLAFISSCILESVRSGGSILLPIGRFGIILLLLEQISAFLESSDSKVPIYFISSVAEEMLAFTNIIPEWLCKQRQEKLFSCEPLFGHAELLKEKRLHCYPALHSPDLLKTWQEPCIVFASHWSLRLGSAVQLLQRWHGDQNSLLVMEKEDGTDLSLLPFMPMAMKVLQCSFCSGFKLSQVPPLLKVLQPKRVLLPEELQHLIPTTAKALPYSVTPYSENETLTVPNMFKKSAVKIDTGVASQLQWRKTKQADTSVARLMGDLSVHQGNYCLHPHNSSDAPQRKPLFLWGSPDAQTIQFKLHEAGLSATIKTISSNSFDAHLDNPSKALIQVRETTTLISAENEQLASVIYNTLVSILDSV